MSNRLWVPPPPIPPVVPEQDPGEKQRGANARRKRFAGGSGLRAACLFTALGLLLICLLLMAVPFAISAGQEGRINLLLLGIDRRGGTGWAYRTDTIMVATLDPGSRTAGILSIPRDLQLKIPGHGEDRINTANVYGSRGDDPDGGPALLESTIETNFGIPIDGYLMVDFQGFERIVDALGGIEVDVPRALHDTRYPDPRPGDPYAYKTVHFEPGLQHMDGSQALVYARSRMSTTDFDRAKRQQLVLIAIRKKALSPGAIPKWPKLAATVLDSVRTDLDTAKMFALAVLALRIETSSLKQVVLEHPLVSSHRRADGAAVQLPNWNLIDPVVADLFGPPSSR